MMGRVIVRVRRPSGKVRSIPSESLNMALTSLADADEIQSLLCEATDEGKALSIELFQNREGKPLLIHFSKEEL
jgi:hypothetical protein